MVTANQVTLGRLLLLPVPVGLMAAGMARPDGGDRTPWLLAALLAYVLLGLTDLWDGHLARRQGATPLGSLLDPLADKVFLVASYGLLAHYRVVPWVPVAILFIRELGVTALRSVALEEAFSFTTSRVAKLKTMVQMAGGGFLLLIWLFPRDAVIAPILGVSAGLALLPTARALLAGRTPGWSALWLGGMMSMVALCRRILPPAPSVAMILWVIVGFTVVSAVEYVLGMRAVLAARFSRSPREGLRLALLSLSVPVWTLPLLVRPGAPVYTVLGVLAVELALGGLDNSLAQAGIRRAGGRDLLRGVLQLAGGLAALATGSPLAAASVLLVTLTDLAIRLAEALRMHVFRLLPRT